MHTLSIGAHKATETSTTLSAQNIFLKNMAPETPLGTPMTVHGSCSTV